MKFFSYYNFFKNFSNPLRLWIILLLRKKRQSVSELVKQTGAEQSKISHHLSILKRCKIIKAERKGKYVFYSLDERVIPLLRVAEKCVEKCSKRCEYAKSCIYG